jgi:Rieske Fe-S protein
MSMEAEETAKAQDCNACCKVPQYRQDFPVEWEGDHYVSRREMVKFLTLGSFLLAAANWTVILAKGLLRKDTGVVLKIGSASILDQSGSMLFRYPTEEDPCIAVRTPQGELVGYSQVCTHLSCAVVYDKNENQLVCPCHRGVFDIQKGAPIAGPPTRSLIKIRLQQRGDQIFATGMEV